MTDDKPKLYTGPEMKLPDEIPTESPTVKALRDGILMYRTENQQLRLLLGVVYAGPKLTIDETLQDKTEEPYIAFGTDDPETIREKIMMRVKARMERAEKPN